MKRNCLVVGALCLSLMTLAEAIHPVDAAAFSREEQARINVYDAASPAVVNVETASGAGSGSIIDATGLVLTNAHVVQGARSNQVLVITATQKRYRGQVIAVDNRNDLALVKLLSDERFPAIAIASAREIRVGQEVFAIGSPFGLSGTFTTGILSRIAPNGDLQTDAAINQGNSGGPLLNSQGELIGVNKAIISPGGRGNVGIGFATSAEAVRAFLSRSQDAIASAAQLNSTPSRSLPSPSPAERSRLGVAVASDLTIQAVERGSLADRLGLRPGDRIIAINQRRLGSVLDLLAFLETHPNSALFTFARNRRLATVQVDFH
jgi:serine protease Do